MATFTSAEASLSTVSNNPREANESREASLVIDSGVRGEAEPEERSATDWVKWYLETLDALVATIAAAEIEWATDSEGKPWVRASGEVSSRPALPAAVVETFPKERDADRSTPGREVEYVSAEVVILGRGDPKAREETLRTTVERMGAVENALYRNRTLSGTCRRLSVAEATPFSYSPGGEGGARGSLAGAKLVCVIEKTATHGV